MPYITEERRNEMVELPSFTPFKSSRRNLGVAMGEAMENGGDLQYMLAEVIQRYLERKGLRYARCEEVMGALDGASKEFYRKVVAPYEETKIRENGLVYDLTRMTSTDY